MKKYTLVEVYFDNNVSVKYFDDLEYLHSYICHDLMYEDLDIEDFKNHPYSGVEERIEEHEVSYHIFEDDKELISLKTGKYGNITEGTWEEFTNFCLGSLTKESKIMKYKTFLESKKDKFPNIKKLEIDGFVVYVGRDAKSNDYLTFNMTDKEDIWMHVKGVPGSHVVIRVRENLPTEEVIKKAAELAKSNSKADKEQKARVVYCQKRFVKKEPGMNDGQVRVDYVNSYEILI